MNFNKSDFKICEVGLGYFGLPLTSRFSLKCFNVVGIDASLNEPKNIEIGFSCVSHKEVKSFIKKSKVELFDFKKIV